MSAPIFRQLRIHERGPLPSEQEVLDREPPGVRNNSAAALCVRAWHDLGTCRQIGMAVGPIPYTAVLDYCAYYELDRELTQLVLDVVRRLDVDRADREASKANSK